MPFSPLHQVPFFFGSGVAGAGAIATLIGMNNLIPPHRPKVCVLVAFMTGITCSVCCCGVQGEEAPPTTTENKVTWLNTLVFGLPMAAVFSMLGTLTFPLMLC
jgi:hypothetical protein